MHIRLEQQGKVLREVDKPHLFMAAREAGMALTSIGEPPGVAAYDFHFARDLDKAEQAQFEALFRNYDPATADNWTAARETETAARKADMRPLKQVATMLDTIAADKALMPDATAGQLKDILERVLAREEVIVKALARLIEREQTEEGE